MAAKIPTLLSIEQQQQQKQLHRPQYQQRWGWRDGHRPKLSPSEESDFIRTYAWPKETELALQCLFKGNYDVRRAVGLIHDARRQTLRLKQEETDRIDKTTFERAMNRHGKKFHLVKRRFGRSVTTCELVSKFYLWKATPGYEKWHDGQREKKRKREAKRLEQVHLATDEHREYCEVCLKGGKLLCCDGCERACHLNCVRPALLDIPEGDWFCSHCRDVVHKHPTQPTMKRNAYNFLDLDAATCTTTTNSKTDSTRFKDESVLPFMHSVRGFGKEMNGKDLTTTKYSAKTRQRTKRGDQVGKRTIDTEDLGGISDMTTESESDGGAAKVFHLLSSNCAVTVAPSKKRRQKKLAMQEVVHRRRCNSPLDSLDDDWSCPVKSAYGKRSIVPQQKDMKGAAAGNRFRYVMPALSLEYCSDPVKPVLRDSMSLQLETASASRKRKRRHDVTHRTLR
ncbi:unnamed protein product [Hyaloperonospora brassicae]|uniref:PHD-type domain-containing protein n=1 Tax=Hyaloperonospora brassicae TaxID=162125 RepID=A0AAV0SXJ9_HYABA|nr:unnamed protein product [Hyaloperonospora brassicae]